MALPGSRQLFLVYSQSWPGSCQASHSTKSPVTQPASQSVIVPALSCLSNAIHTYLNNEITWDAFGVLLFSTFFTILCVCVVAWKEQSTKQTTNTLAVKARTRPMTMSCLAWHSTHPLAFVVLLCAKGRQWVCFRFLCNRHPLSFATLVTINFLI